MTILSIRGKVASLASIRIARVWMWVSLQLVEERGRWPLWLPVGFGTGISFYFLAKVEPPPWFGAALLLLAIASAMLARSNGAPQRPALFFAAIGIGVVSAGFSAAQLRSIWVAAPILERTLDFVEVTGRVVRAEPVSGGVRLILAEVGTAALPPSRTPERVRIRVGGEGATRFSVGDRIKTTARLLPPPGPAVPGGFDFQRRAWFSRIGAVGFSFGLPERIASAEPSGHGPRVATLFAGWRTAIFKRVTTRLDGPSGAVAAALMTGERGAIPANTLAAVREAGLAHLLAISGLHIGLVAGFVFLLVRSGLAVAPDLALRWPLKKIAAALALLAALFYMMLAGASVPTQRAVVMTGIVLFAVMVDRTAISLRLVAWAAVIVLVIRPEALLGPSFQMSFAAVIALVAAYELLGQRLRLTYGRGAFPKRLAVYLGSVASTSVIATIATAPLVLFHFNQIATYGLFANMIAVPLTAAWVMPLGVLTLLAMPFGLDGLPLTTMGWGIDIILWTAQTIASWPGAVQRFPNMPLLGLAAAVAGGLWLCLMQQPWRWAGLVGLAAAAISIATAQQPDILVDRSGDLLAVRSSDGGYRFSSLRRASFTRSAWLRHVGQTRSLPFPDQQADLAGSFSCDPIACIVTRHAHTIAIVFDPRALAEDCRAADIVVAPSLFLPAICDQPEYLLDRGDLFNGGAHVIYLRDDGHTVTTSANGQRGRRPWVPRARQR